MRSSSSNIILAPSQSPSRWRIRALASRLWRRSVSLPSSRHNVHFPGRPQLVAPLNVVGGRRVSRYVPFLPQPSHGRRLRVTLECGSLVLPFRRSTSVKPIIEDGLWERNGLVALRSRLRCLEDIGLSWAGEWLGLSTVRSRQSTTLGHRFAGASGTAARISSSYGRGFLFNDRLAWSSCSFLARNCSLCRRSGLWTVRGPVF